MTSVIPYTSSSNPSNKEERLDCSSQSDHANAFFQALGLRASSASSVNHGVEVPDINFKSLSNEQQSPMKKKENEYSPEEHPLPSAQGYQPLRCPVVSLGCEEARQKAYQQDDVQKPKSSAMAQLRDCNVVLERDPSVFSSNSLTMRCEDTGGTTYPEVYVQKSSDAIISELRDCHVILERGLSQTDLSTVSSLTPEIEDSGRAECQQVDKQNLKSSDAIISNLRDCKAILERDLPLSQMEVHVSSPIPESVDSAVADVDEQKLESRDAIISELRDCKVILERGLSATMLQMNLPESSSSTESVDSQRVAYQQVDDENLHPGDAIIAKLRGCKVILERGLSATVLQTNLPESSSTPESVDSQRATCQEVDEENLHSDDAIISKLRDCKVILERDASALQMAANDKTANAMELDASGDSVTDIKQFWLEKEKQLRTSFVGGRNLVQKPKPIVLHLYRQKENDKKNSWRVSDESKLMIRHDDRRNGKMSSLCGPRRIRKRLSWMMLYGKKNRYRNRRISRGFKDTSQRWIERLGCQVYQQDEEDICYFGSNEIKRNKDENGGIRLRDCKVVLQRDPAMQLQMTPEVEDQDLKIYSGSEDFRMNSVAEDFKTESVREDCKMDSVADVKMDLMAEDFEMNFVTEGTNCYNGHTNGQ